VVSSRSCLCLRGPFDLSFSGHSQSYGRSDSSLPNTTQFSRFYLLYPDVTARDLVFPVVSGVNVFWCTDRFSSLIIPRGVSDRFLAQVLDSVLPFSGGTCCLLLFFGGQSSPHTVFLGESLACSLRRGRYLTVDFSLLDASPYQNSCEPPSSL